MLRIIEIVSIALLLAISSSASGRPNEIPHKVKYERTQTLPTGVAFNVLLTFLVHRHNTGDTESVIFSIQDNLELNEFDASAFLTLAISTKQAIDIDTKAAISSHACSTGEAYDLMDQAYDIEESVAGQHYDYLKVSLDKKTRAMLDRWISETKSTIVYKRLDFEKADQITGKDSTYILTRLCMGE